jgi:hypothetical protein
MFGTIRKHQTWLWAIIITVIIISFVIFFSPYSKMNDSRRGPASFGTMNGQRISEEEFYNALREVELRSFFMNGRWPGDQEKKNLEEETYKWLMLVQKEKNLGIHISDEVAAQTAKGMLGQLQRAGIASPDVFAKQVLEPHGMGLEDFERFVRHYLGVQEMIATIGLSGKLVTPQEARALYQHQYQEVTSEAVFFSASNYLASVTTPPEAISQFYSNRLASYRIPDLVQVSFVKFDLTNYLEEANQELARMTNMDLQIDQAYRQGGTNFLREVRAATLEEARVKIRDAERKKIEAQAARKKAAEFANPLFDMDPVRAENLEKVAKEKGLTVGVTAPFDRENGPRDLELGPDFAQRAFSRTPTDPFAGPILGQDAVYVIALNKKIPSEIPPLDKIREQVIAHYKSFQALTRAHQAGMEFYPKLTNELAQGKTFSSICLAEHLKPVSLPAFSLSTQELPEVEDRANLGQLKDAAFKTPPGKASPFLWPDGMALQRLAEPGGFILYVKAKLPVDEAKMNAGLAEFTRYLRQSWQSEAFNAWFGREAKQALSTIPAFQAQQPSSSTGAGAKPKKS